jgi:hypothetical protein
MKQYHSEYRTIYEDLVVKKYEKEQIRASCGYETNNKAAQ